MAKTSGHLCKGCWVTPWGAEGWKQYWESLSDTDEGFKNMLSSPYNRRTRTMSYTIPAAQFFQQAESCVWCGLLDRRAGLSRYADRKDFARFEWTLSFPTAEKVIPAQCTKIEIICVVHGNREDEASEGFFGLGVRFDSNIFCLRGPEDMDRRSVPNPAYSSGFFSPSLGYHGESGFNESLVSRFLGICAKKGQGATAKSTGSLPRRILDLKDPERPRLRECDVGEAGEYACLSYRWGSHRTQSDFAQLARRSLDGIAEPGDFPKGFLDAATIAKGLSVSYLWIDALCIMQDDPDDLIVELSKMDLYYANASLTIQCCGPDDLDQGFLGPRRLHPMTSLLAKMCDADGKLKFSVGSRTDVEGLGYLLVLPFWLQGAQFPEDMLLLPFAHDDQPLYKWYVENDEATAKRAWVLQEDLLSTHLVRFPTSGGLVMQCKHKDVECHDGSVMYDPMHRQALPRFHDQKSVRPFCEIPGQTLITDEDASSNRVVDLPAHIRAKLLELHKFSEIGRDAALHIVLNEDGYSTTLQTQGYDKSKPVTDPNTHVHSVERLGSENFPALFRHRSEKPEDDFYMLETPPGYIRPAQLNDRWLATVDNYCERDLTNPGDKLTAIAAVAKIYSDRYGDCLGRYCAGLWSNFIVESLLWKVESLKKNAQRTPSIPSFSWGSVQGALYADLDLREQETIEYYGPDLEVLASESIPVSTALTFGPVQKASILLRGLVMEVHWQCSEANVPIPAAVDESKPSKTRKRLKDIFRRIRCMRPTELADAAPIPADLAGHRQQSSFISDGRSSDDKLSGVLAKGCAWRVDGLDDEGMAPAYPDHPDFVPSTSEPLLFLLVQRSMQFKAPELRTIMHGLLLQQCGSAPSQWRRVGYARRLIRDWDSEWQARFQKMELTLI